MTPDVLEDKVSEAAQAYCGRGLIVDTCALNFGPWDEDPYEPFWSWELGAGDVGWLRSLFEESKAYIEVFDGLTTQDVYDEFFTYTNALYGERHAMHEADAATQRDRADKVLQARTLLQTTIREAQLPVGAYRAVPKRYWEAARDQADGLDDNDITDLNLVNAAFNVSRANNEPVTILSGDSDLVRYSSLFCETAPDKQYDFTNVNVALIRHGQVVNYTWRDW